MSKAISLSAGSMALFVALVEDAPNWSGSPLFGGNVGSGEANKGHLTDLKKKGLVTTWEDEGNSWVDFTTVGALYALGQGIRHADLLTS